MPTRGVAGNLLVERIERLAGGGIVPVVQIHFARPAPNSARVARPFLDLGRGIEVDVLDADLLLETDAYRQLWRGALGLEGAPGRSSS
jgi:hypothetical protein